MFRVNRRCRGGLPAVLAFAFTLFSALAAAGAHTQSVCSVPGDHATIQAAVADPRCETVNLGAGTFYESVTISRTVTLQGQGADLTIVEGEENDDYIFWTSHPTVCVHRLVATELRLIRH
jgi:nitrous oxidase accessory protein NosD